MIPLAAPARVGSNMSADRAQPTKMLRVVTAIEAQIARGDLAPGAQLPTISELAEQHNVSVATIKQALAVLRHYGRIVTRQGVGSFVADRPTE